MTVALGLPTTPTDRFGKEEFFALFHLLGFGQDATHRRVLGHDGVLLLSAIQFRMRVALLRHLDGGLAEVFSECLATVRAQKAARGKTTDQEEIRAICVDDARFWVDVYERLNVDPADCILTNAKAWLADIGKKQGSVAVAVA